MTTHLDMSPYIAKAVSLLMAAGLTLPLAACSANSYGGSKQNTGTVLGAIGGAAAGAAIGGDDDWWWAAGLGALAGGVVGNQVGAYLDARDQQRSYQNANYALNNVPDGQTAKWSNPENQTSGYTKPVETSKNAQGQTCREFQTGVTAQGQSSTGTGTACRQADGTWKIIR
ncbi:RT0821/Lpp0805 family surface protein [Dongia sp.]|uniref:RT0821/Lpp0805 family surface protein n=1 Tax=Dongia sp. TaxID=1977262 RepID=UPI0035B39D66